MESLMYDFQDFTPPKILHSFGPAQQAIVAPCWSYLAQCASLMLGPSTCLHLQYCSIWFDLPWSECGQQSLSWTAANWLDFTGFLNWAEKVILCLTIVLLESRLLQYLDYPKSCLYLMLTHTADIRLMNRWLRKVDRKDSCSAVLLNSNFALPFK